jgi:hypothetical protein
MNEPTVIARYPQQAGVQGKGPQAEAPPCSPSLPPPYDSVLGQGPVKAIMSQLTSWQGSGLGNIHSTFLLGLDLRSPGLPSAGWVPGMRKNRNLSAAEPQGPRHQTQTSLPLPMKVVTTHPKMGAVLVPVVSPPANHGSSLG